MATFRLRYDLRLPDFGAAQPIAQYGAAIEQCVWAEKHGFEEVLLSEHHGSPDGYLPSPLVLGGAIANATERMVLKIAALIAPMHDFKRLAEDLAVLDIVSGGRVVPVVSGGYVESEFAMFGRKLSERPKIMEAVIPFLRQAWLGQPFEYEGRTVCVTPRPAQDPMPIFMGGASEAAARRVARLADGFLASMPQFNGVYRSECIVLGKPDPGAPPPELPTGFIHVAKDPDAAWAKIAPHAMHETNAYGKWMTDANMVGPYSEIDDAEALRARGDYLVCTPEELVAKLSALGSNPAVLLHPLMGGMPADLAWQSLELIASDVIPRLP